MKGISGLFKASTLPKETSGKSSSSSSSLGRSSLSSSSLSDLVLKLLTRRFRLLAVLFNGGLCATNVKTTFSYTVNPPG